MSNKKLVVDISNGTQQYIELTAEEIAEQTAMAESFAAQAAELEAQAEAREALKVSARAKLTAGEPLTEEEAAVLTI